LLHSYHDGMLWADAVTGGVIEVLNLEEAGVDLHIEHMDAKRYGGEENLAKVKRLLVAKYRDRPPDAMLTCDDAALRMGVELREEIGPQIPVVFCGVNFYAPWMERIEPAATGVIESYDLAGTLDAALQLHPDAGTLAVVNDRTITGEANRKRLGEILPAYRDRVEVQWLTDLTVEELQAQLRTLPGDAVVLLLSFNRDRAGRTLRYRQSIALISEACERPIYGVWGFYLGRGIVGGKLTEGDVHGAAAARMVRHVLDGVSPGEIPVLGRSPSRYQFDANLLERFAIAEERLPAGSRIAFREPTFFEQHRDVLLVTVPALVALLLVTGMLLVLLQVRHRTAVALREARDTLEERVQARTAELEAANTSLQAEIHERQELENQLLRAEQLAAIGTLAGGVAHEFNNINVTILGFTELALSHPKADTELRDFLGRIHKAARRAKGITSNLLTFSQPRKAPPTRGNLVPVVRDTVDLVRKAFENAGVELVTDLQPVADTVMETGQIGQVILNLLTNAQHAVTGCKEKSVRIETGGDGACVWVRVHDSGCGVSPEDQRRIFTPFFSRKGERARDAILASVRGTGLGLSVSQRIMQNHRGDIEVRSVEGKGSTFTAWLPQRSDPEEEVEDGASVGEIVLLYATAEPVAGELRQLFSGSAFEIQICRDRESVERTCWELEVLALVLRIGAGCAEAEGLIRGVRALPSRRQPRVVVIVPPGGDQRLEGFESGAVDLILEEPVLPERMRRALAGLAAHRKGR
jgi:signal transduction histidine kinase